MTENATPHHTPAPLQEMAETIVASLVEQGISADQAAAVAQNAINAIVLNYRGQRFYVSKSLYISDRDRTIYRQFTGSNQTILAKQHDLTVRSIEIIIARHRQAEKERTQLKMFP